MANLAKETLSLLNNQISGTSAAHEHDQLRLELRELRQAALEWNSERSDLRSELSQLKQLLSDSDQAAALALERQVDTAVNRIRADFTVEAENLRSQIEELTRTIDKKDADRSQLVAQLEEARRLLTETDQAAAIALEFQISAALGQARREFIAQTERLHRELEQLAAERDQARQELAASREQYELALAEAEMLRQQLQRQFDDASIQWDKDRARIVAEHDRAVQELASAKEQHQRELAGAETFSAATSQRDKAENEKLRQKLSQVLTAFEMERAERAAQHDRATRALADQAEQHCRMLSETREAAERDKAAAIEVVRSELKGQTEKLRQEMQQQLAQIVTDTRRTTLADLAVDSYDDAPSIQNAALKENPVRDGIRAEIARVEALIRTISEVIEDEATELSVVIRKNAERSELESYLKGIRFSISE